MYEYVAKVMLKGISYSSAYNIVGVDQNKLAFSSKAMDNKDLRRHNQFLCR